MIPILNDIPWASGASNLLLPNGTPLLGHDGRPLPTASNQIILWTAIVPDGAQSPPKGASRFAVVVDTGFGDTFLIRQQLLEHWTGAPVQAFQPVVDSFGIHQHVRVGSALIPKIRAHLLAYPNSPGQRDRPDLSANPVPIQFTSGIMVWPTQMPGGDRFRLPLLGMLGVREAGIDLEIDGVRGVAQMSV